MHLTKTGKTLKELKKLIEDWYRFISAIDTNRLRKEVVSLISIDFRSITDWIRWIRWDVIPGMSLIDIKITITNFCQPHCLWERQSTILFFCEFDCYRLPISIDINRWLISSDIDCIDWFPISISIDWLRLEIIIHLTGRNQR